MGNPGRAAAKQRVTSAGADARGGGVAGAGSTPEQLMRKEQIHCQKGSAIGCPGADTHRDPRQRVTCCVCLLLWEVRSQLSYPALPFGDLECTGALSSGRSCAFLRSVLKENDARAVKSGCSLSTSYRESQSHGQWRCMWLKLAAAPCW